jgi:hypothetical protein
MPAVMGSRGEPLLQRRGIDSLPVAALRRRMFENHESSASDSQN